MKLRDYNSDFAGSTLKHGVHLLKISLGDQKISLSDTDHLLVQEFFEMFDSEKERSDVLEHVGRWVTGKNIRSETERQEWVRKTLEGKVEIPMFHLSIAMLQARFVEHQLRESRQPRTVEWFIPTGQACVTP